MTTLLLSQAYKSPGEKDFHYSGTIRQDRVKSKLPISLVEKFYKTRGHYETIVLSDQSQIVTRWNDNTAVTLISSSCLGNKPLGTAKRYSREQKKYLEVPRPHVVAEYNEFMFGVDRFDQNTNHLGKAIGGKK